MRAAARIGQSAGTCGPETVDAIDAAIDRFGLPRTHAVDESRVLAKMGSDKKKQDGRQRWVLPLDGGGVTLRDDIGRDAVIDALRAVSSSA